MRLNVKTVWLLVHPLTTTWHLLTLTLHTGCVRPLPALLMKVSWHISNSSSPAYTAMSNICSLSAPVLISWNETDRWWRWGQKQTQPEFQCLLSLWTVCMLNKCSIRQKIVRGTSPLTHTQSSLNRGQKGMWHSVVQQSCHSHSSPLHIVHTEKKSRNSLNFFPSLFAGILYFPSNISLFFSPT